VLKFSPLRQLDRNKILSRDLSNRWRSSPLLLYARWMPKFTIPACA